MTASSSPSKWTSILVFLFRYILLYFSYSFFTPAILFCVAASLLTMLNTGHEELVFMDVPAMQWIFSWLGFAGTGSYNEEDILRAYAQVSLIIFILDETVGRIVRKFHLFPSIKPSWLFSGYTVLTFFLLVYVVSAFLPSAKSGSVATIPTFMFIWGISVILYAISHALRYIADKTAYFYAKAKSSVRIERSSP